MTYEYDNVIAVKDLSINVRKGCRGIVVWVYETPRLGYEVEFFDDANQTIEVLTVEPNDVTKEQKS